MILYPAVGARETSHHFDASGICGPCCITKKVLLRSRRDRLETRANA